ncbi:MAG: YpmA family protein [Firmicutes bacterium]|nr:YpmA family protein [Bacillota bacterium]
MDDREHRVIGAKDVTATDDLYVLVDFLNRILKDKDVIFGLAKAREEGKCTVTIYRTD